jgi:hypothetical protein
MLQRGKMFSQAAPTSFNPPTPEADAKTTATCSRNSGAKNAIFSKPKLTSKTRGPTGPAESWGFSLRAPWRSAIRWTPAASSPRSTTWCAG